MNFINPAAFYALITIAIVILLYFLKLKRKKIVISNLFLFNKMLVDQKANRPFQRLKKNLLLFIQILFLLVAIFGLARPTFIKDEFSNFNYIIIIDSSASMKASDEGGVTRFQKAKSAAKEIVENFAESDMAMIITADSKTHIRAPMIRNKKQLLGTIRALKPAETPTDLYDAFIVALSVIKQKRVDKIYVISDGANIGLERLEDEHKIDRDDFPEVDFLSIGKGNDNVGIVDLDINSAGGKENNIFQVFARVVNFSNETRKCDLELYNSDSLVDVKEIEIPTGESLSVIFDNLNLVKGLVYLKLSLEDALDTDNHAYAYMKTPEKIKVLLITHENLFLENVLSVNRSVNFIKVAPESYNEDEDHSKFDLVIFDRFSPKKVPDTNLLLINTGLNSLGISASADVENVPDVIDYDKTHPVMKYINFDNTAIAKSTIFNVPDWMQKIVETENASIVYAGEKGTRRVVLLTFSLGESDFILKSTFPIFFYNSMFWLSDHFDKKASSFFRTGEPVKRRVYDQDIIKVTTPDMSTVDSKVFNNKFYFDDTKLVGLYTVRGRNDYEDFFIANLLNEEESNITPSPFITIGGLKVKPSGTITVRKELWKYFIVFALLFLFLEWWVYHRKAFE
jgi:hypothetical protein